VILDSELPGLSGLDICRKIRNNEELKDTPLVFISAKNEEIDIILGLELGADDYVVKPFSPKVLFSRVKAILRRKMELPSKHPKILEFGAFSLETDHYILRKDHTVIPLTLSILKRLIINKGKVLTRNHLLDDIQNSDAFIVDRNIDVHIASLRKKLGPNFHSIKTVRGVGYRFVD
ncbi:MAG TPA: response regulator transcription factor, partial [Parachlamydiaceae bacterium]|nr:response regulator transcription factor [Parachlamydiaceae bacterium]